MCQPALQLGVLGWCAEFDELIAEVKSLGFDGNMASATRDCALQTCREILRLPLDVQMQLIILYMVCLFNLVMLVVCARLMQTWICLSRNW
jgi:hypothetical protein